jgi:hypothetical protein
MREADEGDHFGHAFAIRNGGKRDEEFQIFPAAEVFVERWRFENRTDPGEGFRALTLDGRALQPDLAGVGMELPEHDAEGCAFAGAVVAEQAEDFAARDFERQRMQGEPAFVGF